MDYRMKKIIVYVFLCWIVPGMKIMAATSEQPMSDIPLNSAKIMLVYDGELPPLPAALLGYKSDNCPGAVTDRAIVAELSAGATLWGLCKSVNGNDRNYQFFIVSDSLASPVQFEVPKGEPALNGILTNPGISNEDRVLSSYLKQPDSGCGTLGEWIWNGTAFKLLNFQTIKDCQADD